MMMMEKKDGETRVCNSGSWKWFYTAESERRAYVHKWNGVHSDVAILLPSYV